MKFLRWAELSFNTKYDFPPWSFWKCKYIKLNLKGWTFTRFFFFFFSTDARWGVKMCKSETLYKETCRAKLNSCKISSAFLIRNALVNLLYAMSSENRKLKRVTFKWSWKYTKQAAQDHVLLHSGYSQLITCFLFCNIKRSRHAS